MSIQFLCPRCQASLNVPENAAGCKGPCPKCGQRLQVPAPTRNRTILGEMSDAPTEAWQPSAHPSITEVVCPPLAQADPPKNRMPRGTRLGCLALALVMAVASGFAGIVLFANRDRLQPERRQEELAQQTPQAKEEAVLPDGVTRFLPINNSGLHRLATHPWWIAPLPPARAEKIIEEIYGLERGDDLIVYKDGKTVVYAAGYYMAKPSEPFGDLGNGGNYAVPLVYSSRDALGRPMLSRAQVIDRFCQLLDWAHASEESFRRTGKGLTNLDGILQLEWPESEKREAQRHIDELKRQPRPRPAPIDEQGQK